MNRKEIISSSYDRFEHGFFKVKEVPLSSCGNNLEYAGKLLIGMTEQEKEENKELVVKLVKGLTDNILTGTRAFVPRTITYNAQDPGMLGEEERWECYIREVPTMEGDGSSIRYVRTDTSYSQYRNMYMGVDTVRGVPVAREFMQKANEYILGEKFSIKRIDGKGAANGNFNTWYLPNVVISKYYLKESIGIGHSIWESLIYRAMQYWPCSTEGDNGANTIVLLYMIGSYTGYSRAVKKKIKDFTEKWLLEFTVKEYSDNINWLMFNKIYNEFK